MGPPGKFQSIRKIIKHIFIKYSIRVIFYLNQDLHQEEVAGVVEVVAEEAAVVDLEVVEVVS